MELEHIPRPLFLFSSAAPEGSHGKIKEILKGGGVMALFYDPLDEADLSRVEAILKENGIEYFLRHEPVQGIGPSQIHVAEEDFPRAEELLLKATLH
jgi:hypothetical protein